MRYSLQRFFVISCFLGIIMLLTPLKSVYAQNSNILYFYVATNGNDAASGSIDAPFRTITKARDAIRAKKQAGQIPSGGATVYVRGGTYEQSTPILLTAQDSGTQTAPIIYTRYQNEQVSITGGRSIPSSSFVASSIPNVYQVNLKALGITDYGEMKGANSGYYQPNAMELFANGKRMELARYPNKPTWGYTTGPDTAIYNKYLRYDCAGDCNVYSSMASEAGNGLMVRSWQFDYSDFIEPVSSINPQAQTISFAISDYTVNGNRRFYIFNSLKLLDAPGEYFIDRSAGILYYYPTAALSSQAFVVSMSDRVFNVAGASNISIERFSISNATEYGIDVTSGSGIKIAGNTFSQTGTYAVNILDGADNTVLSNTMTELGDGGVFIKRALRTKVLNNKITTYSQHIMSYRPGVYSVDTNGTQIANNDISDSPTLAIWPAGQNTVVEYNRIHNVIRENGDLGAIHLVSEGIFGNIIRYNYFYDIDPNNFSLTRGQIQGEAASGIYMDDFTSYMTIVGNILENTGRRGIFINSGSHNLIENNIMLTKEYGLYIQFLGTNTRYPVGQRKPRSNVAQNNVYYKQQTPFYPAGGTISANTCHDFGFESYVNTCSLCGSDSSTATCDSFPTFFSENTIQNLNGGVVLTADPGITNPSTHQLLAGTSAAITAQLPGFQAIPISRIGQYSDEYTAGAVSAPPIPTSTTTPASTTVPTQVVVPTAPAPTLPAYLCLKDANNDGVVNTLDFVLLYK